MISGGTSGNEDNHLRSLGLYGIRFDAIGNRSWVTRQVVSISGRLICHRGPKGEPAGVTGRKREKTTLDTPGPSDEDPIGTERLEIRVECGSGEGAVRTVPSRGRCRTSRRPSSSAGGS